ncbi:MAG: hypothetical protein ACRC4W_05730 [Treponemataceae bacterium]
MKLFIMGVFLCFAFQGMAQEINLDRLQNFSIGGGGLFYNDIDGGYCDMGFKIYSWIEERIIIRNHFQIGGGIDSSLALLLFIRERILVSFITPVVEKFSFSHYYGTDFAVMFLKSKIVNQDFFDLPLAMEVRVLAGSDFIIKGKSAIFIESGLAFRFASKGALEDFSGLRKVAAFISIGKKGYIAKK